MDSNNQNMHWSSRGMFILATAGAAIGLGNIWKFPYMLGENGGSAFLFIYLACVCFIGIPLMVAELVCGRYSQADPVTGLEKIAVDSGHSKRWGLLGYWGIVCLIIVLSFYSVVSGWSLAFAMRAITGTFTGLNAQQIGNILTSFLASPYEMIFWHTIFMMLTMAVVSKGVQQGLERATKFLMPALFALLIFLVGYAMLYGNASKALHFLFDFNPQAINTSVILAAMGHSFFTLALGAGAIMTYGRYVTPSTKIFSTVAVIALLDTLVSVLAGLAIFPFVFSEGLNPSAGPTLMFNTLPSVFANIEFGPILGLLFFVFLFISAWTSSINIAQPIVTIFSERFRCSINRSTLACGLFIWTLGILWILSFNVLKAVTIDGQGLFDIATQIPDKLLLPVGGIIFAIFAGRLLSKKILLTCLPSDDNKLFKLWLFLVRTVCPLAIFIVLVTSWFN